MKNAVPKMDIYETLYRLNRGFEIIVMNCKRLEEYGLFQNEYLKTLQMRAEELRAGANHELTETLRAREQEEWAHYERLNRKLENRLKEARNKQHP
jgi:hypothetical protein